MDAILSANGNVIILSESSYNDDDKSCSINFGIGVRKGRNMSDASLDSDYDVYTFESGFHSPPPDPEPATVNPGVLELLLF